MSTDFGLLVAHLWLIASYFADSRFDRFLMFLMGIFIAIGTIMGSD